MSKKADSPSLNGLEALRAMERGNLAVEPIYTDAPIFTIISGSKVTQHWLSRDPETEEIQRNTIRTYFPVGIFLAPIWKEVPDWEIEYLFLNGQDLQSLGIHCYDFVYYRLIYMQDEDLDHLFRQLKHTLANCRKPAKQMPSDALEAEQWLYDAYHVFQVVKVRDKRISSIHGNIIKAIPRYRNQLDRLLKRQVLEKQPMTSLKILQNLLKFSGTVKFRPLRHNLIFVRRSLNSAIKWLERGDIKTAGCRINSAIKWMVYPETS